MEIDDTNRFATLTDEELMAIGRIYENPVLMPMMDPVAMQEHVARREGRLAEMEVADDDDLTHQERARMMYDRMDIQRHRVLVDAMADKLVERTVEHYSTAPK